MLQVTFGRGLTETQGKTIDVPAEEDVVAGVARLLEDQPPGVETWWSTHVWRDSKRSGAAWVGSAGVGVDVDYYEPDGTRREVPDSARAAVDELARTPGRLPGNIFHWTPRGLRIVFVFAELCTDRDQYLAHARSAAEAVAAVLEPLGGFKVDNAVIVDLGRLLFSPRSRVKGVQRDGRVLVLDAAPRPLLLAPPLAEPSWTPIELPGNAPVQAAIARYNEEHAREIPRLRSTCPVCGHNGCWGQLKDDPARWSCFSASHSGAGRRSVGCWVGDSLDIDAFLAGLQPIELLRREGYLAEKLPPPPSSTTQPTGQVIEVAPTRSLSKSYATCCYAMRDPGLRELLLGPGDLEYDEQLLTPTIGRKPITEAMINEARERGENFVKDRKGRGIEFGVDNLTAAVQQVARERPFHPLQDYLRGLRWDGVPRIDSIAGDILHVPVTALTLTMLRRWMISAVARGLQPGCKVDTALILVGPQGAGKSTFFSTLAGPGRFSDSAMDLSSKDAYLTLRRFWIVEWSELESMARAGRATLVKAFLSSPADNFRAPYERTQSSHPRSCVIVGSTNDDAFLSDPTGGRRMWTLATPERIDVELLAEQRDQLWAEAVAAYHAREVWWLDAKEDQELAARQDEYQSRDVWESAVEGFVEAQSQAGHQISTASILTVALEKPKQHWTTQDNHRIAQIMRRLGWAQTRARNLDGTRPRVWRRA